VVLNICSFISLLKCQDFRRCEIFIFLSRNTRFRDPIELLARKLRSCNIEGLPVKEAKDFRIRTANKQVTKITEEVDLLLDFSGFHLCLSSDMHNNVRILIIRHLGYIDSFLFKNFNYSYHVFKLLF